MTKDDIAHVDVFVTTKHGTRAYEYDLFDKDQLWLKYTNSNKTINQPVMRTAINSNWYRFISGPEAGTLFHKPNSLTSHIHTLMDKKKK